MSPKILNSITNTEPYIQENRSIFYSINVKPTYREYTVNSSIPHQPTYQEVELTYHIKVSRSIDQIERNILNDLMKKHIGLSYWDFEKYYPEAVI